MLWEELSAIEGLRLYGPTPALPRTPTISFTIDGISCQTIARGLAEQAIFASHGDFYAPTVLERLGVDALLRVGCAAYSTEEEVRRLIAGVRALRA